MLLEHKKYFVLSLLYKKIDDHIKMLDIWTQIASGEVYDPDFGGIDLIVDHLKSLSDKEIVFRYGSWVLSRDPTKGVQIFIDRCDDLFKYEQILTFLQSFGASARKEFLEHVIFRNGVQV